MRDPPEEGELDPAVDVRRRCMKNSPSVLSCIDKRTKESCNRGSEVGTVHSVRGEKGPFLLGNRRNLARENFEKDFFSR